MSLSAAEEESREIHLPAEIDWHKLDKSRFFLLGAALFSGLSAALYPAVVLKTRQQVSLSKVPCLRMAFLMLRHEGFRSFYRGFGTSLTGTIPARALYSTALEITKSSVGSAAVIAGLSDATAAALANAAGGLSASMAAQLVWTPVDVVSQRLMVQGSNKVGIPNLNSPSNYSNGVDAFRKILYADGVRGLYRGFGISILTYAPSSAVWWGSYSVAHRLLWGAMGFYGCKQDEGGCGGSSGGDVGGCGGSSRPNLVSTVTVQVASAALASGASSLTTMPLDTIKTRLQVLQGAEKGRRHPLTVVQTMRNLRKEGGFAACYRGLCPRWASMSMSTATMVTTYEFLKRLSAKTQESLA
ncbi:hypothetical protein Nepgr_013665 [Nepenthes gracilis]|uniref:Solute carrier family 25 member 44-like n=1 Tax=Nepenthes gracilis TaxID=150966 RepID=A0AAD3SJG8_NEPGR|nr:hypothetical protein Nepgr_013665 [Nepenthes gracilis]